MTIPEHAVQNPLKLVGRRSLEKFDGEGYRSPRMLQLELNEGF